MHLVDEAAQGDIILKAAGGDSPEDDDDQERDIEQNIYEYEFLRCTAAIGPAHPIQSTVHTMDGADGKYAPMSPASESIIILAAAA